MSFNKFKFSYILVLGLAIGFNISVHAAEFYRKQTGTTTIPNGSTSVTVAAQSVNVTQSFLVFSSSCNSNSPTDYQIGGKIIPEQIKLYNAMGKLMLYSISLDEKKANIDIRTLNSGIYLLQISDGLRKKSYRIVKH